MKKAYSVIALLVALLVALVMALSGMAFAEETSEEEAVVKGYVVGDKMDDFTITLTDGTTVSLYDLLSTHKAVLINIWATWCGPCRMEFPYMEEAYAQVQDDVAIVAVSCEETDTDEVINAFKEENGLSILPMAADTIGLSNWFDFDGIPTSIMVDRFGVICWQESGSITSTDTFLRLFNAFTGDDYTESLVGFEIPKVMPNVEAPAVEDAAAAAVAENGNAALSFDTEDEYAWPWVVTEDGLASSNAGVDDSYANVEFTVNAAEGDVFSFDAKVSAEEGYDHLYAYVDGAMSKIIDTGDWDSYTIALTEGEHVVTLSYVKDTAGSDGDDMAWVKNAKLVTGEEAAAIVAALPVYPHSLESGVEMTVNEPASEIVFEYASDESKELIESYFGDMFYIANGDTASVNVAIGADVNPEFAVAYNNCDGMNISLSDAEIDGDVYVVSGAVSAMDLDGYSYNEIYVYDNFYDENSSYTCVTFFQDEQNVNAFVASLLNEDDTAMITSWQYADGTLPSTDEIAELPDDGSVEMAYAEYTLLFVDEDGNPVEGVIANVCDDTSCEPMTSDAEGRVEFIKTPFAYHIQVIKVPDGYTFDTSAEYYTEEAGGEMTFQLTKAAE